MKIEKPPERPAPKDPERPTSSEKPKEEGSAKETPAAAAKVTTKDIPCRYWQNGFLAKKSASDAFSSWELFLVSHLEKDGSASSKWKRTKHVELKKIDRWLWIVDGS